MIEARELSKDYGATRALRNVSFKISPSEVVGLLGPNGAGKTTLMKILTGFMHPSTGEAQIDGIDVVENPLEVQQRIGYLPENAPLYPDMLVQDYLTMIARMREIPEDRQVPLISEAVHRTGLEDYLVRPIGQLSKGYRQRVGLAQAILHGPKVLILDEPTSGLDPNQIVEIRKLIKELAEQATVLISTHILSEVEVTCERVMIINEGEMRADAKLEELQVTNAAVLAVEGPAPEVKEALAAVEDVTDVTEDSAKNGFSTYRVTGGGEDLCPKLFDLVKDKGWRLAELRPDHQTLESIFRDIVEHGRAGKIK